MQLDGYLFGGQDLISPYETEQMNLTWLEGTRQNGGSQRRKQPCKGRDKGMDERARLLLQLVTNHDDLVSHESSARQILAEAIWVFPKIFGTPKSSILIGFSIIFTIHFGIPLFLETSILLSYNSSCYPLYYMWNDHPSGAWGGCYTVTPFLHIFFPRDRSQEEGCLQCIFF